MVFTDVGAVQRPLITALAMRRTLSMDIDPIPVELRRLILTYAEHDPDYTGVDANARNEQTRVCICGLATRLDEILEKLDARVAK